MKRIEYEKTLHDAEALTRALVLVVEAVEREVVAAMDRNA